MLSRLLSLCALVFAASAAMTPLPTDLTVSRTRAGFSWSSCGTENDALQITSVEMSPSPPVPGKPATLTVVGTAQKTIEDGAYAVVTVKLGLIKLLTRQYDLCEEADKGDFEVTCPVNPGTYTVKKTFNMPTEVPAAKFRINVQGYTADEEELTCVDVTADFMRVPGE